MADNDLAQESAFATVYEDTHAALKSQAVRFAAQLKLADLVKDEPRNIVELAQATGMNQSSLYRLLHALTSIGYFTEVEPSVFAQSPLSYTLRTDIPRSLNALAIMRGDEWSWLTMLHGLQTIQTGKEVFPSLFGKDVWRYFAEDNPEAGRYFAQAMRSVSAQADLAVARGYDFSTAGTIIDIGGGQGSLLSTILQIYPDARATLFDQPRLSKQFARDWLLVSFRTA